VRTVCFLFGQYAQQLVNDCKKSNAGYPVNETLGDKSKSPNDSKNDGGFGQGNSNDGGNDGH
jgi:outer membrane protein assembly factor BamE